MVYDRMSDIDILVKTIDCHIQKIETRKVLSEPVRTGKYKGIFNVLTEQLKECRCVEINLDKDPYIDYIRLR